MSLLIEKNPLTLFIKRSIKGIQGILLRVVNGLFKQVLLLLNYWMIFSSSFSGLMQTEVLSTFLFNLVLMKKFFWLSIPYKFSTLYINLFLSSQMTCWFFRDNCWSLIFFESTVIALAHCGNALFFQSPVRYECA